MLMSCSSRLNLLRIATALCLSGIPIWTALAQPREAPDGWNRFAYSRSSGIEVLVEARGGTWCRQAVDVKLVAENASTLRADVLQPFFETLSDLLTKDCPEARYFTIAGVQKGSDREIYQGEAAAANGWFIIDLNASAAAVQGKSQKPATPQLSPEQQQRLDTLLGIARDAKNAKSKPGRNLKVQKLLKELGLYSGPLNGKNDKATQAAITEFKKSYGLPANGEIDDAFLAALNDPNALIQN